VVAAANLPLFVYGSIDPGTLASKDVYMLTNGVAALSGPAKLAQDNGAKRAAVVVVDVPAASGPVKAIGPIFYKNAGTALDIVSVPPGTPDMTPQIQTELAKSPDQMAIIGDATFCTSALKAMKTLGFAKTIVVIPQCLGPSTAQSVPGGLAGVKVITALSTDASVPEVKLFNDVMSTYASGTEIVDVTSGGYAAVLGFARAVSGLSGDVTPDTVRTTLAGMSPAPLPLAPGITFQCNGKQVSFAPAICSTGMLVATLDQSAKPQNYQPFDASAVQKLG
jgi:ABC-type branched-subunit amino acid transport system substrate-binding protein